MLAACSPRDNSADVTTVAPTDSFGVALLTPGSIADQAWNGAAYEGLLRIKDSLGARTSHIEVKTPSEFEENFRQYGSQGYRLVIGHGAEFQDAAMRVAPEFPRTIYVSTGGNQVQGNAIGLEFAFEEGSYLAGVIAANQSKTNVVGCIGGTELVPVRRSFAAFAAGARSVKPDIQVLTSYVGNWDDASAGKEQALAQIGRRADVIFGNADAAGLGIFQAAKESKGVRVIGANSDQSSVAPDVVIGSVVIDIPHAFLEVAREVRATDFAPRVITFGTASDVVRWVYNPALQREVSAGTQAAIDSLTAGIRAGTFTIPRDQ
jgi:basic membrane lipoprotein Med (substrate-binding protein (PBP1-ABC) superfamily)